MTDTVGATEFDFKSTAMHELLHAFGFSSYVGENGEGLTGQPAGTADTWSIYDQFLTDASGNRLVGTDGVFDPSKVGALTSGGVTFNGPNAMAANGGNGVPIYSPSPWEEGSSIAHTNDDDSITAGTLMNAATFSGLGARTLTALEIGILKDIGYASVVPVPAAVWLFFSGIMALFGFSRKHRRPV